MTIQHKQVARAMQMLGDFRRLVGGQRPAPRYDGCGGVYRNPMSLASAEEALGVITVAYEKFAGDIDTLCANEATQEAGGWIKEAALAEVKFFITDVSVEATRSEQDG